jgi:hypothetical protein
MEALADSFTTVVDDGTDERVGRDLSPSARRELECDIHPLEIDGIDAVSQ